MSRAATAKADQLNGLVDRSWRFKDFEKLSVVENAKLATSTPKKNGRNDALIKSLKLDRQGVGKALVKLKANGLSTTVTIQSLTTCLPHSTDSSNIECKPNSEINTSPSGSSLKENLFVNGETDSINSSIDSLTVDLDLIESKVYSKKKTHRHKSPPMEKRLTRSFSNHNSTVKNDSITEQLSASLQLCLNGHKANKNDIHRKNRKLKSPLKERRVTRQSLQSPNLILNNNADCARSQSNGNIIFAESEVMYSGDSKFVHDKQKSENSHFNKEESGEDFKLENLAVESIIMAEVSHSNDQSVTNETPIELIQSAPNILENIDQTSSDIFTGFIPNEISEIEKKEEKLLTLSSKKVQHAEEVPNNSKSEESDSPTPQSTELEQVDQRKPPSLPKQPHRKGKMAKRKSLRKSVYPNFVAPNIGELLNNESNYSNVVECDEDIPILVDESNDDWSEKKMETSLDDNGIKSTIQVLLNPLKTEDFTNANEYANASLTPRSDYTLDSEIDEKPVVFELGHLVWAQLAKYPYWPAIICPDPDTKEHKKNTSYEMYHLRFFGDHGRRAWIRGNRVMLYYDKNQLDTLYNKLKSENPRNGRVVMKFYTVPSRLKKKWGYAIEELESLKNLTYDKIIEFLTNSFVVEMRNRKRRRTSHDELQTEGSVKVHARKRFKSCHVARDSDLDVFFNGSTVDSFKPCPDEIDNSFIKEETDGSRRRSRRYLRPLKSGVVKSNIDEKENEVEEQISEEVSKPRRRRSVDKLDPSVFTVTYLTDLHKRNNLFNGVRLVKVCGYCMKPDDLYKCKGRCGMLFHLDCASKVTLPLEERKQTKKHKRLIKSPPVQRRSEMYYKTRSTYNHNGASNGQYENVTARTKRFAEAFDLDILPADFEQMSIAEQIDIGMKEMMSKLDSQPIYEVNDSSSEDSCDENSDLRTMVHSPNEPIPKAGSSKESSEDNSSDVGESSEFCEQTLAVEHVTADSVLILDDSPLDITNVKCAYCRYQKDPPCFLCGLEVSRQGVSARQKCNQVRCFRFYHSHCLKAWPQTQWSITEWSKYQSEDSFSCAAHICHTCFSEELGGCSEACRFPSDRLARCMLCPAAFHTTTFCIPAGSEILGGSQIICPRHRSKISQTINTAWCFICSEGGNLVCCDTCPTSVHPECQPSIDYTDEDKFICEDCETGRFPLYNEIVWVKLGSYRWWPALVLFPNEVPENVRALKHGRGDFVVKFFGSNDHYWVNKSRAFLFQEGDSGDASEEGRAKSRMSELYYVAVEHAKSAYKLMKEFMVQREPDSNKSFKPPPFAKINKNKPVGNVKCVELDSSNATACECNPNESNPCGLDSNCINRLLLTECDPEVCLAGRRCGNQAFQKRDHPRLIPHKTQGRGWGLKTLSFIEKGRFIIEYVGELIDNEEYNRRIKKMHEKKEENYYFMTMDGDRMIDAGPKGNLSRFMNHSCDPNCVTQKWTVKGDTRVGLFANQDIEPGSELTFNYNLEVVGQEKKVCKCGAGNCSGFIGGKVKQEKPQPYTDNATIEKRPRKYKKKIDVPAPLAPPCFICNQKKSDVTCVNKFCNKGYHLKCINLIDMPDATRYTCPRHHCNICSSRTIRCCVSCTDSFCPPHSLGNVRHDKFLGFVCNKHDPTISPAEESKSSGNEDIGHKNVSSTQELENMPILKTKEKKSKKRKKNPPKHSEEQLLKWRMNMRRYRLRLAAGNNHNKLDETKQRQNRRSARFTKNRVDNSSSEVTNEDDIGAEESTAVERQNENLKRKRSQVKETDEATVTSTSPEVIDKLIQCSNFGDYNISADSNEVSSSPMKNISLMDRMRKVQEERGIPFDVEPRPLRSNTRGRLSEIIDDYLKK